MLFKNSDTTGNLFIDSSKLSNVYTAGTRTFFAPPRRVEVKKSILEENLDYTFPPSVTTRRHRKEVRATDIARPSVYILFDVDEVVYVGQSINAYARMSQHLKDKHFTHIRVMPCKKSRMNYWEKKLIRRFRPEYNVTHNLQRRLQE